MRRFWSFVVCLLLATSVVGVGVGEEVVADVIPLPEAVGGEMALLTVEEDPMIGPHEEGYVFRDGEKYAGEYTDPSITVHIGTGRFEKTNYMYARVKIATPEQLRTSRAAASINSEKSSQGTALAARVNAVIAINGDFLAESCKGSVIRQGEVLRMSSKGDHDVMLLDKNGDMHILQDATDEDILKYQDDAVNVFTFGPGLIINGEPQYGYTDRGMATHKSAQRMAFCQTGPLEYLMVTSEGPENPGSEGLKLDSFIELLTSFGDIQNAYNLDGGNSATIIFRKGNGKNSNWSKINAKGYKPRDLRDIIYFADAWIPETVTEEAPAE